MSEVNLDVKQIIIDTISEQIQGILNADPTTYGGYSVFITNEREFIKTKEGKKPKSIHMVVKFLDGSKDLGQQRQPFSINALSEYNTIGVCQKLLMDWSETYNLVFTFDNEGYTIKQALKNPVDVSNFNEVFEGYRAVFYLTGTFYIGVNSNPITAINIKCQEDSLDEDIQFISAQLSFDAQPDSQPFFGTNNFNRTVAKIGTLSIGFSMYAINTDFYNGVLDLIFNDGENQNINKTYNLNVTFKSGKTYSTNMKLINVSGVQELRDFPAMSFTFVR